MSDHNSHKSQQSMDSAQGEVFLPAEHGDGAILVQEEDLQSEVYCSGGECTLKRRSELVQDNPVATIEPAPPQKPSINVVEECIKVPELAEETVIEEESQEHQSRGAIQDQMDPVSSLTNRQSATSQPSRPDSLVTDGQKLTEVPQQQTAESPAEEKVLAQIRAKRNVSNLIAKFNSGIVEDQPAALPINGKQKLDETGKIQQMRQKFNNQ